MQGSETATCPKSCGESSPDIDISEGGPQPCHPPLRALALRAHYLSFPSPTLTSICPQQVTPHDPQQGGSPESWTEPSRGVGPEAQDTVGGEP